jgi:NAD+ synthase
MDGERKVMYKLTEEQRQTVITNASTALAKYCTAHDIKSVVIGSSGGLDSAVTIGLAARAREILKKDKFELNVIGVVLPCHSSDESRRLGHLAIDTFGVSKFDVDLSGIFSNIYKTLDDQDVATHTWRSFYSFTEEEEKVSHGNIMARIRMIVLYHIAKLSHGMVLSTDNLSELWMGFWTLHGDVGDYGMIQQVMKGLELYDIAKCLGVPQSIIDARPDDGLGITEGGDEAQLGSDYRTVDITMLNVLDACEHDDTALRAVQNSYPPKIINRFFSTEFKRNNPINLTRKELGLPPLDKVLEEVWKEIKE